MSGCHLGIDSSEDFEDRVAVPGFSIKATAYLIGEAGSFGHVITPLGIGWFAQEEYTLIHGIRVYWTSVILSFGDKTTEDIYHGRDSKAARRISRTLWPRIQMKLDLVNAAISLEDLQSPPANRLERLRGDLNGFYSIRVNQQYRLVFRFEAGNCTDLRCTDYH
jgi:proteic killer suppression protein